ncbi:polyamine ABC transporter substrate-binding protein [Craterilacuibacter sinensis]|uniref:Putrescine-binding periplasmic protein n=1 Tax=Craterilacuibacter sinensis TaxID=2686017 RepID=A0A845BJH2_9NEIS|nr:polyamine ABC transporter substrate-binding protein [Craterilacuibacter sinensis]MXR36445.1 extracellular solute-binding protein [Craterilacuibacter sinensis]
MKTKTIALSALITLSAAGVMAGGNVNIYNWTDYVAESTVPAFSKATGIKVRYDVFDSNEILRAKLMTGQSGYDVVVPSHNTLALGIKAGLFQPLDMKKIPNAKNLDPAILKLLQPFDPGNRYAVPNFWGFNTVGINTDQVKKALGGKLPENPWDLIFKPEILSRLKGCGVSVLDSPSEFFPVALHYYGKDPNSNNLADYQAIMPKLMALRPYITRFSSSSYYNEMAGGSLCAAMGYNGDFNFAQKRAQEAKNGVKVQALLPKTGLDVWVDVLTIPKDAPNVDNAHAWINAMLEPKMAAANANHVAYATSVLAARPYVKPELTNNRTIYPTSGDLKDSFVAKPLDAKTMQGYTRLWQKFRTGH